MPGSGRQRHVQIGARGPAAADHGEVTRIDRIAARLVYREGEHRGILDERALGAIAMVHVPIDHRHPPEAMDALRVPDQQNQVAEHAVSPARGGFGMMSGRAHQCVRIAGAPAQHRIAGGEAAAGGQQRDLIACRTDGDAVSELAAVSVGKGAHPLDVGLGVEIEELGALGRARLDARQPIGEAAHFEEREQATLARGRLRVLVRLHIRVGVREARTASRVVPEIALVADQSRRQSAHEGLHRGRGLDAGRLTA